MRVYHVKKDVKLLIAAYPHFLALIEREIVPILLFSLAMQLEMIFKMILLKQMRRIHSE